MQMVSLLRSQSPGGANLSPMPLNATSAELPHKHLSPQQKNLPELPLDPNLGRTILSPVPSILQAGRSRPTVPRKAIGQQLPSAMLASAGGRSDAGFIKRKPAPFVNVHELPG